MKTETDGALLKEKVHAELKHRIINCEMVPGEAISEEKLAAEFGLSRTPIREALLQLKREKLVDIWARKGIFVKEIVLKDIYEIYQMRILIEPNAAKLVTKQIPKEKLLDFQASFKGLDPIHGDFLDNFRIDRAFHDFIIESTGNGYLKDVYADLLDQNQRIRILTGKNQARVIEGIGEHLAIVAAFLSRDEETVFQAILRHLRNSQVASLRLEGFAAPR